jgi:hypothetical protein
MEEPAFNQISQQARLMSRLKPISSLVAESPADTTVGNDYSAVAITK